MIRIFFKWWFDSCIRAYNTMIKEGAYELARNTLKEIKIAYNTFNRLCKLVNINPKLGKYDVKEIKQWIKEEMTKLNHALDPNIVTVNLMGDIPENEERIKQARLVYLQTTNDKIPVGHENIEYIQAKCQNRNCDNAVLVSPREQYVRHLEEITPIKIIREEQRIDG